MSNLRTNYKDDVFTGSRKYEMTQNGDGTVSFTDQTTYSQVGDTYGAAQINEANAIINNLDDKAYLSDDGAESGLADNDYFPFYDTSASNGKKTTWSNIKNLIKAICAIKDHASTTASTYGAGTASQFGHVKLSDAYLTSGGSAANSVGASSAAVNSAYTKINNQLKANNNEIYMDYKNGKYGYNTSANRGADTFHPFKGDMSIYLPTSLIARFWGDGGWGTAEISFVAPSDGSITFTNMTISALQPSGSYELSSVTALLNINGASAINYRNNSDARIYTINQTVSFTEGQTLYFLCQLAVDNGGNVEPLATLHWTWNLS